MSEHSDNSSSRYDMNQRVGGILTRRGVDLESLSISCSGKIVYLNGFLQGTAGKQMTPLEIDYIFREIEQISQVRGIVVDFENWVITNNDGGWIAMPKRGKKPRQPRTADPGTGQEHRLDPDEKKIAEVLEEIRKKET